jgi:transcriptional regulator with XRE-family HTH domain
MTPPARWTGREAAALREAMRLSLREFAALVGVGQRTVSEWEKDGEAKVPRPSTQRLLDAAYRQASPDTLARFHSLTGTTAAVPSGSIGSAPKEDATFRRTFLAAAAAVTALAIDGEMGGELDRCYATLDRGSASEARIAHFEAQADALGVRAVQDTPQAVLPAALKAMRAVRGLLEERQPTRHQARLGRVTAMLATVAGECLFNAGQFASAGEWYACAAHAARDAGDGYLADIALCGQAYLPTYSGDPRGVIALLEPRLAVAAGPSPAVAWLWGFLARAYAATRQHAQFARAIDQAAEALDRSPSEQVRPGIFSFRPEKLAFYTATSAVQLGDSRRALDAADCAIALYPAGETTEPTLARLERASALAGSGEVGEACRAATATIIDPGTYHGVTVRQYAAAFDARLPGDCPDVRQWRDVLAAVHAQADA